MFKSPYFHCYWAFGKQKLHMDEDISWRFLFCKINTWKNFWMFKIIILLIFCVQNTIFSLLLSILHKYIKFCCNYSQYFTKLTNQKKKMPWRLFNIASQLHHFSTLILVAKCTKLFAVHPLPISAHFKHKNYY